MKNTEIKALRERLHLTQKALAQAVGVEPNTVARWERGEMKISSAMVDRVKKVAEEFPSGDPIKRTSSLILDSHHRAILEGLNEKLDPEIFEACATDLLKVMWPRLVPVRGGGDDGFDGAVADRTSEEPFPLIITTSQNLTQNFNKNLNRACKQEWKFRRLLFATSRRITPATRKKLYEAARQRNVTLMQTYDQDWFALQLYREPDWCKRLLGVTGKPHALSVFPLTRRPIFETRVFGRKHDMQWLLDDSRGDCVLAGEPGSGKTFLLRSLTLQGKARFMVDLDRAQIAKDLYSFNPPAVIVDDAHVRSEWIENLVQLRDEVRAEFRIIATCWPGETSAVCAALRISSKDPRKLDRIDADTMIEIIKSTGVLGPDRLLRLIRKQAAGLPGLAVTLAHLCLVGDVKSVVHGQGLMDQLSPSLNKVLGDDSTLRLAPFALGGNAGVKPSDVAEILNESVMTVTRELAKLAASGIIFERPENSSPESGCPLSVEPPEIRGPLVRRGFYNGAGSLSIEDFLPIVCNPKDALETLIDARSGDVSILDIEHLLEKFGTPRLWEKYAFQGQSEVNYVLDRHPELLVEICRPALLHAPDRVIPKLLEEAVNRQGQPSFYWGQNENPILDKLKPWIEEDFSNMERSLQRRVTLLQHAQKWWIRSQNSHVAISTMCIALNPAYRTQRFDPGNELQMILTDKVLPPKIIDKLTASWPLVAGVIRQSEEIPWDELFQLLRSISNPRWAAHDDLKAATDRFAQYVVNDLADISRTLPGVQRKLKELANWIDFELSVNQDPVFECLYPDQRHFEGFDSDQTSYSHALNDLAENWKGLSAGKIANLMADIEAKARAAEINYPRESPKFCEILAERCSSPIAVAKAFMGHELPFDLVKPFVSKAVSSEPRSWSIVNDCLDNELYVSVGISVAITHLHTPPEILTASIAKAEGMGQLIETHCLREEVPESTLFEMFSAKHAHVAVAAATGHWMSTEKCVDGFLKEMWSNAILRSADAQTEFSQHDDYWIGEILKHESELATAWMTRLVQNEKPFYGCDREETAKKVAKTLNEEQRRKVLRTIPTGIESHSIQEILGALVGNSLDLYRELLASTELANLHLTPLAGKPNNEWAKKAMLALDAGYTVDQIVEATQILGWVWAGNDSDMWAEWRHAFETLLNEIEPRIVSIGKRGAQIMLKREQKAKKREQQEAVNGYL